MNSKELKGYKILLDHLLGAPTIIAIEPDRETLSAVAHREDCVMVAIFKEQPIVSSPSIISINGDPVVVAQSWLWPVDMVVINHIESDEKHYRKIIANWIPRTIHKGIFAFCHYGSEKRPYIKPAVDFAMKDYEQFAYIDNLVAYQITDPLTQETWDMMKGQYDQNVGVVQ